MRVRLRLKSKSNNYTESLDAEIERTGVEMDVVKDRYHFVEPEKMSEEIYDKVMQAFAKTKSVKVAWNNIEGASNNICSLI